MSRLLLPLFALLFAGPVLAEETVDYSDALVKQCLSLAENPAEERACAGVSAKACQDASDYGSSTIGLQECSSLEREFWDQKLNAHYTELMARARAADAEGEDDPRVTAKIADKLREMQRRWIPFRDATCAYEASQWQGGTISGPVYADCLLRMTADQAVYLEHSWPTY